MAFQKPFKEVTGGISCRHYQLNPKRWSGRDVTVYVEYRSIPDDRGFYLYRLDSFFSVDNTDERLYLTFDTLIVLENELDQLEHKVDEYVKKMLRDSSAMLIIQDYIKDYSGYDSEDGGKAPYVNPQTFIYRK